MCSWRVLAKAPIFSEATLTRCTDWHQVAGTSAGCCWFGKLLVVRDRRRNDHVNSRGGRVIRTGSYSEELGLTWSTWRRIVAWSRGPRKERPRPRCRSYLSWNRVLSHSVKPLCSGVGGLNAAVEWDAEFSEDGLLEFGSATALSRLYATRRNPMRYYVLLDDSNRLASNPERRRLPAITGMSWPSPPVRTQTSWPKANGSAALRTRSDSASLRHGAPVVPVECAKPKYG